MHVLVGCECSGIIREAFAARGHDAWSCDLKPSDQPGQHLKCDLLEVLDYGWDLLIAHPDCTYLTASAEWAYNEPDYVRYPDFGYHQRVSHTTLVGSARREARQKAFEFVMRLWNSPIPRIAIENPVGYLSKVWQKPSQIIQPYEFGDDASKATCLWLRELPLLRPASYISELLKNNRPRRFANQTEHGANSLGPSTDRAAERSRTYPGIALAMAEQWG